MPRRLPKRLGTTSSYRYTRSNSKAWTHFLIHIEPLKTGILTGRFLRRLSTICTITPVTLNFMRKLQDILSASHSPVPVWSLDIFSGLLQSPEGRTENSPGLRPWERHAQGNRPERASESH